MLYSLELSRPSNIWPSESAGPRASMHSFGVPMPPFAVDLDFSQTEVFGGRELADLGLRAVYTTFRASGI